MTDRFPDSAWPKEETFRADLPGPPRRRGPRMPRGLRLAIVAVVALALLAGLGAAWVKFAYLSDLPAIPNSAAPWPVNAAPGMTFLDRTGARIAARGPRRGRPVRIAELPAYVPQAFLAAEDRRFYKHGAVDWWGATRAAFANLRAGQVVQGGSTLSQQLAKTLFLKSDRTFKRKVQEAVIAGRLEKRLGKTGVLELYLNRVFFGADAFGIEAAAQTYFGKPASQLTLAEAAMLAGLPKAPSRLSPVNDKGAALARERLIINRMADEGWIGRGEAERALARPPLLVPEPPEDADFGHVLDMAQAQAATLAGGAAPDLVVTLSIDSALQRQAADITRRAVAEQGRRAGAGEAALVALGPDGGVRALIGGVDHSLSRFNRATQAQRQPGSAFKPFVYAAALDAGVKPNDVRKDAPVQLGPWSPRNYGGGYSGPVKVEDALARSINTVAVRLAQEAGPQQVADLAYRFGLTDIPPRPSLSIALGAYEVNLLALTSAYQVFQQDGRTTAPWMIIQIADTSGRILWTRRATPSRQVYDPARGADMVRMLKAVIERGTGKRAGFGRPAAGKTGTSESWRDAWFVGFTPDWVCGVWVGNDDNRPMDRVAGGDLPAQIWRQFMLAAHQGLPARDFVFLGGEAPVGPALAVPSEPRGAFYQTLAAEFARAKAEAQGGPAPEDPAKP